MKYLEDTKAPLALRLAVADAALAMVERMILGAVNAEVEIESAFEDNLTAAIDHLVDHYKPVDAKDAPKGYRAVSGGCNSCDLMGGPQCEFAKCGCEQRKDGRNVAFIKLEHVQ